MYMLFMLVVNQLAAHFDDFVGVALFEVMVVSNHHVTEFDPEHAV